MQEAYRMYNYAMTVWKYVFVHCLLIKKTNTYIQEGGKNELKILSRDVLLNQLIIIVEWSGNVENFKVANKWAAVYIEPYLTQCTSFVLGLLIFK